MKPKYGIEQELHDTFIGWLEQWSLHRYEHPHDLVDDALDMLRNWGYKWADGEDASLIDRIRAAHPIGPEGE